MKNKPNEVSATSDSILQDDSRTLSLILDEMGKIIVGQEEMMRFLLMGLLTGGHVLIEGLPGLAKTLAVKTLSQILDAQFRRIQFTPDLLPSDLLGTLIFQQNSGEFIPKKGPIFANIILADEINRAPAKVQSALLESMAEKQVTIGEKSYPLEEPFLVLATQNPIEQEGTYPLPEAQLDRFLFKLKVVYPTYSEEREILEKMSDKEPMISKALFKTKDILRVREHLPNVYVDERIKEYVLRLVLSTRKNHSLNEKAVDLKILQKIQSHLWIGVSPRATLGLIRASRANALLERRNYVVPDDVKTVLPHIFRHRMILHYEAEARNVSTDDVISEILDAVYVP